MTGINAQPTYDRSICNSLRWRVTLNAFIDELSDPMLASLVSTPDIEVGAVIYEVCRMLVIAGDAGRPMDDLHDVLDLLVINKHCDLIRDAIADLMVWSVGRADRVLDEDGPYWVGATFEYVLGVPMRPEEIETLLDFSRAGTTELWDELILDGMTTTAMLAMAARALGYLCDEPTVTLTAVLAEFSDQMDEIYDWARGHDEYLRNR